MPSYLYELRSMVKLLNDTIDEVFECFPQYHCSIGCNNLRYELNILSEEINKEKYNLEDNILAKDIYTKLYTKLYDFYFCRLIELVLCFNDENDLSKSKKESIDKIIDINFKIIFLNRPDVSNVSICQSKNKYLSSKTISDKNFYIVRDVGLRNFMMIINYGNSSQEKHKSEILNLAQGQLFEFYNNLYDYAKQKKGFALLINQMILHKDEFFMQSINHHGKLKNFPQDLYQDNFQKIIGLKDKFSISVYGDGTFVLKNKKQFEVDATKKMVLNNGTSSPSPAKIFAIDNWQPKDYYTVSMENTQVQVTWGHKDPFNEKNLISLSTDSQSILIQDVTTNKIDIRLYSEKFSYNGDFFVKDLQLPIKFYKLRFSPTGDSFVLWQDLASKSHDNFYEEIKSVSGLSYVNLYPPGNKISNQGFRLSGQHLCTLILEKRNELHTLNFSQPYRVLGFINEDLYEKALANIVNPLKK